MNTCIIEKMQEVANTRGIMLHIVELEPQKQVYVKLNQTVRLGHDEIIVGCFEDEELALIAFFKEVGHCMIPKTFVNDSNYSSLMQELEACNVGIREATKHNVLFSDKAIQWMYTKALQWVDRDEKMYPSWNITNKPKLFVNQIKDKKDKNDKEFWDMTIKEGNKHDDRE